MPANTPLGLPYPLPTEPVAEGAQAIRNLAEAAEAILPNRVLFAKQTADQTIGAGVGVLPGSVIDITLAKPSLAVLIGVFDITTSGGVLAVGTVISDAVSLPGNAVLQAQQPGYPTRATVAHLGVKQLAAGARQFNLGAQTLGGECTFHTNSTLTVLLFPGGDLGLLAETVEE